MDLTTGYPYSLVVNGIPSDFAFLEASLKTDVVIIGGGISGALTAYYLTNAGIPCILVDKRTIGLGSTCASTSLVQYELDIPLVKLSSRIGVASATAVYSLCYEAIDTIQSISEKIGFDGFKKQTSLYYAANYRDKKLLESEYEFRKKAGFKVALLEEQDIQQQFGFCASSAILSSKAAITDAYMFTYALLKVAVRKGLKVFDRTEITRIDYQKKGVRLLTTKGLVLSAKKVINASGYEVTNFLEKGIVKLYSTYAMASEHLSSERIDFPEKTLLWNTADPYLYMRRSTDNRILVGGRDEKFYSPIRRDKLIKRKTAFLRKDILKLFPGIDFNPEFSWTGTFGVTKDSLPYIGTYSQTPNTYYALGFGGNGIVFSVLAAELIRDSILNKPNKNISFFSFDR
jgi:glycine/D-amino acid oxidase-like deaminating enzyme